jgi:MFS family permease
VQGLINAVDMPTRQAFLIEIVDDRHDLSNAIALNSSMFNGARLVGPTIAGILLDRAGAGFCFLIDGVSYLAVIAALLAMRVKPQPPKTRKHHIWHDLKEGFVYSYRAAPIRAIFLLLAVVSIFGISYSAFVLVFAKTILQGGPHTYGLLMAASGTGALCGALYMASRDSVLGLGRVIAFCSSLFAVSIIVFAFSRLVWLSVLVSFTAGFGMMVHLAASNTILQTIVEDDKRSRVMGFYATTVLGLTPLGSLFASGLVALIGAPYTVALGGAVSLLGSLYFIWRLPSLRAAARPMLERAGVLPPIAAGIESATQATETRALN